MKKNRLGTSDLYVSEIGLGCMSLGRDQRQNEQILHKALELGINFFDTADLYDRGENEISVGKAFKGRRDEIILATKVGNRWRESGDGWDWDPSKTYIKEAVHNSLKRLKSDYIDLYQLHGGTLDDPLDETIEAFEELKAEGLIRYYGISSIRPNVIREWVKRSDIVSVMMQYSLLDRRPEEEALGLLQEHDIGVIVRGPVAKGLLTGRKKGEGHLDYSPGEIGEIVEKLHPFTSERRSPAQLALRYALAHPAVTTVIPGASRIEQLLENAGAAKSESLSEEELRELRSITRANRYEAHR